MTSDLHVRAKELFDSTHERLADFDVHYGMRDLIDGLAALRADAAWRAFAVEPRDDHPLFGQLMQDPITAHSYCRPRGYAGDAMLLDLIYGAEPIDTTGLGAVIYAATFQSCAARVARWRLERLRAILIGEQGARVLSVACGHLRELAPDFDGEFFALDHDAETIAAVKRTHPAVTAIQGSIRSVLSGQITFAELDLVYAAGLYDYLPRRLAKALTLVLLGFLRAGGRLLTANYLPGLPQRAYMEAFMRWNLVYRTDQELYQLAADLPATRRRIFHDREGRMAFLELTK